MDPQHFKVSEEHERIIEEFKYLLSLDPKVVKQQLVTLLNKLKPFLQYPLDNPPPIEFVQVQTEAPKIITEDLKTQLSSYCFLVLRGCVIISKQSYQFTEQKYLDEENIREKSVYNFEEGKSRMRAQKHTVYLKIHNIWIKRAKKKSQQRQKQYIKKKLISLDFFSQLTFEQFNQCCSRAYLIKLGPEQILIKQNQIPYNMYVVAEGQLSLETSVKFSKEENVWNQVRTQIKKNNQFCEELFQYLVREPRQSDSTFEANFCLKQIHQGQIVGAKETLLQQPLKYTIKSTLKTKIICLKYPDLYVFKEERLMQIRSWPYLCQIDKKQLRRQYYSQINWNEFKKFLKEQNDLSKVERTNFDMYLRKNVNLNSKRYNFCPQKVGEGKIIDSPAAKVIRMNDFSTTSNISLHKVQKK